mmetsp:Transcript_96460/g.295061  ORF Transcript_96460/g.295061 Transcript_96460/m.295061 type:complete len:237 (-) Transcript_96460:877-1587(-)
MARAPGTAQGARVVPATGGDSAPRGSDSGRVPNAGSAGVANCGARPITPGGSPTARAAAGSRDGDTHAAAAREAANEEAIGCVTTAAGRWRITGDALEQHLGAERQAPLPCDDHTRPAAMGVCAPSWPADAPAPLPAWQKAWLLWAQVDRGRRTTPRTGVTHERLVAPTRLALTPTLMRMLAVSKVPRRVGASGDAGACGAGEAASAATDTAAGADMAGGPPICVSASSVSNDNLL